MIRRSKEETETYEVKTKTTMPCMIKTNNSGYDNPCKCCLHYKYGYCEVEDENDYC